MKTIQPNEKTLIKLQALEKKLEEQIQALTVINNNLQGSNQTVLEHCSTLQNLASDIQKQVIANTQKVLDKPANKISYKKYMFITGFCLASLVTGTITGISSYYLLGRNPIDRNLTELPSELKSDIFIGQSLKRIWPLLSKKEQDKIAKLIRIRTRDKK